MRYVRDLLCGSILSLLFFYQVRLAEAQQTDFITPTTIHVTSRLVFLDVTVVDKKGHPVVKGLTKDDFTITDDKRQQRIFSFEPPDRHVEDASQPSGDTASQPPLTIYLLDLLDSDYTDFAYIRSMMRNYLMAQPSQLRAPAELMVLGNQSLEMVQGFTQSKTDLLYALDHVAPTLPYKDTPFFVPERFVQSVDALQQIALQNRGVPGRKNIVWVGNGGPGILLIGQPGTMVDQLNQYVHDTTNMLVDSRVSLFLIYPGLKVLAGFNMNEKSANADISDNNPFPHDINFGVFVKETGGRLFSNRNDISDEIQQSVDLGSEYYTLTYQPEQTSADKVNGRFRHMHVALRDRNLRAMTKEGYFTLDKNEGASPQQQRMVDLSEAARSSIAFNALGVSITDLSRHPDTNTAQFTVLLSSKNLEWHPTTDGRSRVDVMTAAASLNGRNDFIASRIQNFTATADNQDPAKLATAVTRIPMTLRIPPKTQTVRVVIRLSDDGRTGTAEVTRKALDGAPQAPTPDPKLLTHRPQMQSGPTTR